MSKAMDEKLEYHGAYQYGYIIFKAKTHHIDNEVVKLSCNMPVSLEHILQAQMDFTKWFMEDVHRNLNGFRGTDCVRYDFSKLEIIK